MPCLLPSLLCATGCAGPWAPDPSAHWAVLSLDYPPEGGANSELRAGPGPETGEAGEAWRGGGLDGGAGGRGGSDEGVDAVAKAAGLMRAQVGFV